MKINEPVAANRTTTVQLTNAGVPVNGAILGTNAALLIAKYGGNMTSSAGATLTQITGGNQTDGLYNLTFAAADCSVVGPLNFELTPTASLTFQDCVGGVTVEPLDCLYYGLISSVVSSTVYALTSPVLTAGYYASASANRVAIMRVVYGTGAGQMRLVTDYASNGQVTIESAFATALDTTSVVRIEACIDTVELSSDTRLANLNAPVGSIPTNPLLTNDSRLNDFATILSALAAIPTNPLLTNDSRLADLAAILTAVGLIPTNPLLTNDTRLNDLDAPISSIVALASLLPVTSPQPQNYGIVSGEYGAENAMPITVVAGGGVVDLSSATSYQLRWLQPNGTVSMVSLTAVSLTTGQLERIWIAGDTAQTGTHRGQVVVTWPDSTTSTYPKDGSYYVWSVFPVLVAGAL